MQTPPCTQLEKELDYRFRNPRLLSRSLRHRTYVHEQQGATLEDNQRFEFLGDAVLGLAVGHMLMDQYPRLKEGDLTRMRASLVNENRLASIARNLTLGAYIQLGRGERQSHGRDKPSILADTFEALVAAIYLDGGYSAAEATVHRLFLPLIDDIGKDYKSLLQEHAQKFQQQLPQYAVIQETGPDHDKTFQVRVQTCGIAAVGNGKSKKQAEQDAAQRALERLAAALKDS